MKYGGGGRLVLTKHRLEILLSIAIVIGEWIFFLRKILEPGKVQNYLPIPLSTWLDMETWYSQNQRQETFRKYLLREVFTYWWQLFRTDKFVRREMKRHLWAKPVKRPHHPIYSQKLKFTNGLPKVHGEHDGKVPSRIWASLWGQISMFL